MVLRHPYRINPQASTIVANTSYSPAIGSIARQRCQAIGSVAYAPMAFRPVTSTMDALGIEQAILERWNSDRTFARSLEQRADAARWVFYEGPPTANGKPGIHHVWARLFKDIYPRFHTMRGKLVDRRAGWDCHGLPVEVEVEKELGFSGKAQIEEYGIAAFNNRCRESVQRYVGDWKALTERIGMWLDTDRAYWTMDASYVESVWWLFHALWEKGLIFEGEKVVPYCGRCGTALSSHELAQPGAYRDIVDNSVYVRFPLVDEAADLVVWTTTPWTLPANVAVAVGGDISYARVIDPNGGRDLILGSDRVTAVLGESAVIQSVFPGSELDGKRYRRPLVHLPIEHEPVVIADAFVTVDDGSGMVHLAPAFGEIDRDVCTAHGIAGLNPVGPAATFVSETLPWNGLFVRDADPSIIEALSDAGLLLAVAPYEHSYPHCWRCSTPLIYWGKPTWFVRTSENKHQLIAANQTVNWHPSTIKDGRFGNWLEHNIDWALSRDRFWGTPIPIWRCEQGHDTCISSRADLSRLTGTDCSGTDPHRPVVDDLAFPCPVCSQPARRVEPVLDAWFDSGAMPAAQSHYPFVDGDRPEPAAFPADFICEGIDQTRGWFYSLLAINTLVFERSPYRNVLCLALVVDKDGQKMSKSKGNVLNPWEVLDTRGADALRWNMVASGSPWTTRRIFVEAIDETTRGFLLTLWNTYSFFVTYANLDGYDGAARPPSRDVMDRWMRSRLHDTIVAVTDALESFDALSAAQSLSELIDDCSNWYVRRSRSRFWKDSDLDAHATLHEVLRTTALLLAPICPFLSEELWSNLSGVSESVHLQDWPVPDRAAIDADLDTAMQTARAITSVGRAARTNAKLKVRQPLASASYLSTKPLTPEIASIVGAELNVKELIAVDNLASAVTRTVTPNFAALGPRVGKLLPELKRHLGTHGAEIASTVEQEGSATVELSGGPVRLEAGDIEVRVVANPGFAVAEEHGFVVALDTELTPALVDEGIARECVRWLNDARKELGFSIEDRIVLRLASERQVHAALEQYLDTIRDEVLAIEINLEPNLDAISLDSASVVTTDFAACATRAELRKA